MLTQKQCTVCKQLLPISEFKANNRSKDGKQWECKKCHSKRQLEWRHKKGLTQPYDKKRSSSLFLGVHIAERLLSNVFVNVERMPWGNKGYDFVCGKGFKVDVKSSCFQKLSANHSGWYFSIKRNIIADYFACIAFDNRDSLTPLHFWIIPKEKLDNKLSLQISQEHLCLWEEFEKPLDKIITCCNVMQNKNE